MSTGMSVGYRLDPLDRAMIGPLARRQVVILGAGALVWLLSSITGNGLATGAVVMAAAVVVAIPRFAGQPIAEWLPVWCGWALRGRWSRRWLRPVHLTTAGVDLADPVLPPWLGGLRIVAHPSEGWAAVHDAQAKTLTVQLQLAGAGFSTLSPEQMQMLLGGWGAVFGSVPAHDGMVRITWSDIARRMPLVGHDDWAAALRPADRDLSDYRTFVASVEPMRHDLILTVTVRVGAIRGAAAQRQAMDRVAASIAIVHDALREAHIDVHGPLSAGEIAYLLRAGLDPVGVEPTGGRHPGSLVQRLGLIPVAGCGPMATETTTRHVVVDQVAHRSFWVESWPESPLAADWFEPLVAADIPGVIQRVWTVVVEPLAEDRAINELRHAAARHGGEQVAAAEGRTRWDHFKQRKAAAVNERERELAAGHSPVAYAGVVTVTVGDVGELQRASRAVQRRLNRQRVLLRPLWGRMELGVAAGLPLGLGLSREPF